MNRQFQKSALQAYNNVSTAINPTTPYTLTLGNVCTDTGCSIKAQNSGVKIVNSGLYTFHFDASVVNGATVGTLQAQLYKDGVPLPCSLADVSLDANVAGNLSFETTLAVNTCCNIQPVFTVVFTSDAITDLTIVHTNLGVVKQA